MAEINPEALRAMKAAHQRYRETVEGSRLQESAKKTY